MQNEYHYFLEALDLDIWHLPFSYHTWVFERKDKNKKFNWDGVFDNDLRLWFNSCYGGAFIDNHTNFRYVFPLEDFIFDKTLSEFYPSIIDFLFALNQWILADNNRWNYGKRLK